MLQSLARALIRIAEDRRFRLVPALIDRPHIGAIAREAIAGRTALRGAILRIILEEHRAESADDRDIEPVHPEERPIAVMAMIMPGHRGRDDEVARPHIGFLAGYGGPRLAIAFDNEAQRRRRMAMRGGALARQNQLQPGIERIENAMRAAEAWILERQDTAIGFARGDELARFQQKRPQHIVEIPEMRQRAHMLLRRG